MRLIKRGCGLTFQGKTSWKFQWTGEKKKNRVVEHEERVGDCHRWEYGKSNDKCMTLERITPHFQGTTTKILIGLCMYFQNQHKENVNQQALSWFNATSLWQSTNDIRPPFHKKIFTYISIRSVFLFFYRTGKRVKSQNPKPFQYEIRCYLLFTFFIIKKIIYIH